MSFSTEIFPSQMIPSPSRAGVSILRSATIATGVAFALIASSSVDAAESFVDTWDNGAASCWVGASSDTNVQVQVDFVFGEGSNGWIRGIATGNNGSQAGILTAKPDVAGNWIDAQASGMSVDIKRVSGVPTSCNFRVQAGPSVNGWHYVLPAGSIADEFTTFSAPVNPNWTDGQAMAAGWVRDNEITLNWQATMSSAYQVSVRASSSATGLQVGFDNFELIFDAADCPADFNIDGFVDVEDLLRLLSVWNTCDCCVEDVNRDRVVDVNDLLMLLADWGECG